MDIDQQITDYIAAQPEPKRRDLLELHRTILKAMPVI